MSRRRFVCLLAATLGAVSVLLGCSGSGSGDRNTSITIGLEGPITGDQSSNGVDMRRAATLAVTELNHRGDRCWAAYAGFTG